MTQKLIKIAHSPDTDDLFMFWALKTGRVTNPDYQFFIEAKDVHVLNDLARDGVYDVTALSFAAYPKVADQYAITASGASFADTGYGPLLVAKKSMPLESLRGQTIAVPGITTTACFLLKLALADFHPVVMRPTDILPAIEAGKVQAGLLIHEGQIQFENMGFAVIHRVIDTWREVAGNLPLPLGCNAIKKSLGQNAMQEIAHLQKQSILYATTHFNEARDACLKENPVLDAKEADRYLSWYANDRTVDFGSDGREAIRLLYSVGAERCLLAEIQSLEIVG